MGLFDWLLPKPRTRPTLQEKLSKALSETRASPAAKPSSPLGQKRCQASSALEENPNVNKDGENIACESCGKQLTVKYFPPRKILLGGPDAIRGVILRCQFCGFLTCIDCAMKPLAGKMQACPSCRKELGPTILTSGVDVLARK